MEADQRSLIACWTSLKGYCGLLPLRATVWLLEAVSASCCKAYGWRLSTSRRDRRLTLWFTFNRKKVVWLNAR